MSSILSNIEHISDTAFWVAYVRSMESERRNPLFHDPYARELAGKHGEEIARSMRYRKMIAWYVAVRTRTIDEILVEAINTQGCDIVLNLAAGLDTRPYRLELPPSLRWIEVDLPAILAYKAEKLAGKQPKCALERVSLDLADVSARREFFDRINAQAKQVFVLMEGLAIYLTADQLGSLVTDLHAQPAFHWLLTEYLTATGLQYTRRNWNKQLAEGNVQMQLRLEDPKKFYQEHGWQTRQIRLIAQEAEEHKREMFFMFLLRLMTFNNAQRRQEIYRDMGGFVLLERGE